MNLQGRQRPMLLSLYSKASQTRFFRCCDLIKANKPLIASILLFLFSFVMSLSLYSEAQALPDLIVQSVDAPATAAVGSTITVGVTFKNQGTDLTQGSYVRCRMIVSPDTVINLADSYYTEKDIPNTYLKAGYSAYTTFSYTLPTSLQSSSNSNFDLKQIFGLGPNFAHSHLATELASL